MQIHKPEISNAGTPLHEASKACIMLHGRGATSADILTLMPLLHINEYAVLAPQAENNAWYPYSFLSPIEKNEPWLTSALHLVDNIVKDLNDKGITTDNIVLSGFSQGACLALEYATRNPRLYGGIVAFSGGLIGDKVAVEKYRGDLKRTKVYIGTSDPDPYIPPERAEDSAGIFKDLNADVHFSLYPGMGHTVSREELDEVNNLIFNV